jgi:hypothetical protein
MKFWAIQAAEKGLILHRTIEKHTSGAEAQVHFAAIYGTAEVVPYSRRAFFRSL